MMKASVKSLGVTACMLLLGGAYVADCGYAADSVDRKALVKKGKKSKKKSVKKKKADKKAKKEKAVAIRKLEASGITEEQYGEKAVEAVLKGNALLLENLLKAGLDANYRVAEGNSLLWLAARDGHAECAKLLLEQPGIEVNTKPYPLWTAVYSATRKYGARPNDCIPLLLNAPGIDLNCREKYGIEDYTPLAAALVKPELFKQLLDAGADVNAHHGLALKNLQDEADEYRQSENAERAAAIEKSAEMLFSAPGFDPNVTDEKGDTILHRLCRDLDGRSGVEDELAWVLNVPGIDVNKCNANGETAAHLLFSSSSVTDECVKRFIKTPGLNLTIKDQQGTTAIQRASKSYAADRYLNILHEAGIKE